MFLPSLIVLGIGLNSVLASEISLEARATNPSCIYSTIGYNSQDDLAVSLASLKSSSFTLCGGASTTTASVSLATTSPGSCIYTTIMYNEPWELATTMELLSVSYTTCGSSSTSSQTSSTSASSVLTYPTSTISAGPTTAAPSVITTQAPSYISGACTYDFQAHASCYESGSPLATSGLLAVASGVPTVSGNYEPEFQQCALGCKETAGCESFALDRSSGSAGPWTCYFYSGAVNKYAVSSQQQYEAIVWFDTLCYDCTIPTIISSVSSISSTSISSSASVSSTSTPSSSSVSSTISSASFVTTSSASSSSALPCSATSVVQNGGFEVWELQTNLEDYSDTAIGWQLVVDPTAGAAGLYRDNTNPHGGQYDAFVYHGGDLPTWNMTQTVTVCPYTDYNLTFWTMNDGEGFSPCTFNTCFDDDCAPTVTEIPNGHSDDISYWVWHQNTRLYTGTSAAQVTIAFGVSECYMFMFMDGVSMTPVSSGITPSSTAVTSSTATSPPPAATTASSSCNLPPSGSCFYITGHGDSRIEGLQLGVDASQTGDGTDECFARFDDPASIWWIDDNQWLHVLEPLDRVTMTEYISNEGWWTVFAQSMMQSDPDDYQPSLCSVSAGILTCYQQGGIDSSVVNLFDFDIDDLPGYFIAHWGGDSDESPLISAPVSMSVSYTDCVCPE